MIVQKQIESWQELRVRSEIAKLPLCLLVAFSSLFGYCLAQYQFSGGLPVLLGVLLLAAGGATLNSWQEREIDGKLRRTGRRPLVVGAIRPQQVFLQSVVLIGGGAGILFWGANTLAALTGLIGLFCYNGVYTRIKKHPNLAMIPGVISGCVPPYIGWLAGGGEAVSLGALLVVLVLLFWQVPHVLLVLLIHKNDYRSSPVSSLLLWFSEPALKRIMMPWVAALVMSMLSFTIYPFGIGLVERVLIMINGWMLLGGFVLSLSSGSRSNYSNLFRLLNMSILLLMIIVCVSRWINWVT